MKRKIEPSKAISPLVGLLLVALVVVVGCKKSEPPAPPQSEISQSAAPAVSEAVEVAKAALVEQTTCPVMGGAIDKAVFVEYQGKKVYFCCPGCEDKFEAEPEKYLAKLPQFQN